MVRLGSSKCVLSRGLTGRAFFKCDFVKFVFNLTALGRANLAVAAKPSNLPAFRSWNVLKEGLQLDLTICQHPASASAIPLCSEAAALFSFTGSPPRASQFPGGGVRLHICSGPGAEQVSPPHPLINPSSHTHTHTTPGRRKWMFR